MTEQFYLTHRWNFNRYESLRVRVDLGVMAMKEYNAHSPKFHDCSLIIRCSLMSYLGHSLRKGLTPLQRFSWHILQSPS